jgi:hypothetical protein
MKPSLTVLVLVLLLLNILPGCASGPNQSRAMATDRDVAGFWLGLWQGFIAPFVFVASLFQSNLSIYEVHNNELGTTLAYLFGLTCLFGGGGNRAAGRTKSPTVRI